MDIVHSVHEARERVAAARKSGKKIGFVPTMGFPHNGHLSLVEISKQQSDYQAMSIFVNKIQFNEINDFNTYPKDLKNDFKLAEEAGVDLIFLPDDNEMYREHLTYVDVNFITDHLCGSHRPGHFKGVFTVVSKLFNIILPDISVFGQKDIQQAISIEKMAYDLNFPVKIIIAPIIREDDGLAMSSRNKRLNAGQRKNALSIYRSLNKAEEMISKGEDNGRDILFAIEEELKTGSPDRIDYITLVDYKSLQPIEHLSEKSVIAAAVFFGNTRLIDNMIIKKEKEAYRCKY